MEIRVREVHVDMVPCGIIIIDIEGTGSEGLLKIFVIKSKYCGTVMKHIY